MLRGWRNSRLRRLWAWLLPWRVTWTRSQVNGVDFLTQVLVFTGPLLLLGIVFGTWRRQYYRLPRQRHYLWRLTGTGEGKPVPVKKGEALHERYEGLLAEEQMLELLCPEEVMSADDSADVDLARKIAEAHQAAPSDMYLRAMSQPAPKRGAVVSRMNL